MVKSVIRTHGNVRASRLSANGWQTSASWRQITWWVVARHEGKLLSSSAAPISEGKSDGR
jgi:predicted acyltransferase (DUF342 family)